MRYLALVTRAALRALDRPVGPAGRRPRGVALIIALVTVVLLSGAVVEFAYATRVNLALASNERDQLKAYYLARSGVNLSRLLLNFQYALQDESRQTDSDMGRMIGQAMRRSNFQMYQYIDLLMGPFNSGKLETPVGGINLAASGLEGFGDFVGKFDVDVKPEEGRIEVNTLAREEVRPSDLLPLCAMVIDGQYDGLFEQKDAFGDLMDRQAVLQNLVDYLDRNNEGIVLDNACSIKGSSGDEVRPYDRADTRIRPRNAMLTHLEELYQIHGISDPFMRAFKDQLTVYGIGRPNINVATAPVFYSILCQHAQPDAAIGLTVRPEDAGSVNLCALSPVVAMEALWLALALDGVKSFFEDPLSVLLAYVGTTESKLLPSAKVGQPVAFLSVAQLGSYIDDFQQNPLLMAQFLQYSPFYQRLVSANPALYIDPLAPALPGWRVNFDKAGMMRNVTAQTPSIYRIYSTGTYGTTSTKIETVVDFGKSLRRLPSEKLLEAQVTDDEELTELKKQINEERERMAIGRTLYWRRE